MEATGTPEECMILGILVETIWLPLERETIEYTGKYLQPNSIDIFLPLI